LRGRQHRPGLFVELQKGDDLRDILREDEIVAARQDRYRARAEALQLGAAGRIGEDVDRFELDPTDREKLFQSQAAGSARLPERLQGRGLRHLSSRACCRAMFAPAPAAVNRRIRGGNKRAEASHSAPAGMIL
jgi:hypothetical protein